MADPPASAAKSAKGKRRKSAAATAAAPPAGSFAAAAAAHSAYLDELVSLVPARYYLSVEPAEGGSARCCGHAPAARPHARRV